MKRFNILFILLFLPLLGLIMAQPRVNPTSKNFKLLAQSGIVENPVGWELSPKYNKWSGYYGVISYEFKNNDKTPISMTPYKKSFYKDNIISMQFKKYESHDSIYYALFLVKYKGFYEYPAIYQDWHYYKDCDVFLFTPEEYHKFSNLKVGINAIPAFAKLAENFDRSYGTPAGNRHIDLSLEKLFNDLYLNNKPTGIISNNVQEYKWYVKLEENGDVRFDIPGEHRYLYENNMEVFNKRIYADFAEEYFEIKPSQYRKLIISN